LEKYTKKGGNMKTKLVILGVLALLSLSLFACTPAASADSVAVSIDDFNNQNNITREITVSAGGSFKISLESNATTGFSWPEQAEIGSTTVVEQTKHEFITPTSDALGAPGKEVWTFKALQKGTTVIAMQYSRPWEGGEQATWTFNLTVTVK
jgi:inhibitor of cysteine peptidase